MSVIEQGKSHSSTVSFIQIDFLKMIDTDDNAIRFNPISEWIHETTAVIFYNAPEELQAGKQAIRSRLKKQCSAALFMVEKIPESLKGKS